MYRRLRNNVKRIPQTKFCVTIDTERSRRNSDQLKERTQQWRIKHEDGRNLTRSISALYLLTPQIFCANTVNAAEFRNSKDAQQHTNKQPSGLVVYRTKTSLTWIVHAVDAAEYAFDVDNELSKVGPRLFGRVPAGKHQLVQVVRAVLWLTEASPFEQVAGRGNGKRWRGEIKRLNRCATKTRTLTHQYRFPLIRKRANKSLEQVSRGLHSL